MNMPLAASPSEPFVDEASEQSRNGAEPVGASLRMNDLPRRIDLGDPYDPPSHNAVVRLNTNEYAYPPSDAMVADLLDAVRVVSSGLHRYPDRGVRELRGDLAAYVAARTGIPVHSDNVWPANGSIEILQQLLQYFGGAGRCILGLDPTYSLYPKLAAATQTSWSSIERNGDLSLAWGARIRREIDRRQPDIVIIDTPNNPTGQSISRQDLFRIVADASGLVIVDEAYGEYSSDPSAIGLIDKFPDKVVVTRTLSKAFPFAGGRLGYLVAAPAMVRAMELVRLPYHLSSITQAVARVALHHSGEARANVSKVIEERRRVADELRDIGMTTVSANGNFVLFGGLPDSAAAWQFYLDRGVLIRDVGIDHHLRVTIGRFAENQQFLNVSREFMAECGR